MNRPTGAESLTLSARACERAAPRRSEGIRQAVFNQCRGSCDLVGPEASAGGERHQSAPRRWLRWRLETLDHRRWDSNALKCWNKPPRVVRSAPAQKSALRVSAETPLLRYFTEAYRRISLIDWTSFEIDA